MAIAEASAAATLSAAPAKPSRARWLVILVPYLWLLVFFLVPFIIVIKISLSAAAVAMTVKTVPLVERSIWNPVSLSALSFHLRVTSPCLSTLAVRLVGADGTTSATVAVLELAELPPELNAETL